MTASIVTALPYKNCYFSRNLMHRSGIVKVPLNFVFCTQLKVLCSSLGFMKTNIKKQTKLDTKENLSNC